MADVQRPASDDALRLTAGARRARGWALGAWLVPCCGLGWLALARLLASELAWARASARERAVPHSGGSVALLAGAGALGSVLHALGFALLLDGLAGVPVLGPVGAALASALVLTGTLAWLAPGAAWWPLVLLERSGPGRPAPLLALAELGLWLDREASLRQRAGRDALLLHAALVAPLLALALALTRGGGWWLAALLALLFAPALALALASRLTRHFVSARASTPHVEAPTLVTRLARRPVRVTLALVTLSATLTLATVVTRAAMPTPAPRGGVCREGAGGTRVALPGVLPGSELEARADVDHVTLRAPDGGGPGRVPLARAAVDANPTAPHVALVETRGDALLVTLCAALDAPSAPTSPSGQSGWTLSLAAAGHRLDDGLARRVFGSPASAALLIGALLVAGLFGRRGWGAWLRASDATLAPRAHAPERALVAWGAALALAQLGWVLATWLARSR